MRDAGVAAARAAGTTASCGAGDGPTDWVNEGCNGVCAQSGSEWVCDLAAVGCVDDTTEIESCCTYDDANPVEVTVVTLIGTPGDDEVLGLNYGSNQAENLGPHAMIPNPPFLGFVYGGDGNDIIYGSDFSGGSYRDNLYGELGNDTITGFAGDDFISAGNGDDTVWGMGGDDVIVGWLGADWMDGGAGNDHLCDQPCLADNSHESGPGDNFMDGGDNADTLWYGWHPDCTTATLDPTSTGGAGDDHFGNDAWTVVPVFVNADLSSEPAGCDDPNF